MEKKEILNYIKNVGTFTIPRLQAQFSLTYKQADDLVKELVSAGVVKASQGLDFVYVEREKEPDPVKVEYLDSEDDDEDEDFKAEVRADRSRYITSLALAQRRYLRAEHAVFTEMYEDDDEDDDDDEEEEDIDYDEVSLGEEYLKELKEVNRQRFEKTSRILAKLRTLEKFDKGGSLPRCDGYDDLSVEREYRELIEEYQAVLILRLEYSGRHIENYDGVDLSEEKGWFTPKKILYLRMLVSRCNYYHDRAIAEEKKRAFNESYPTLSEKRRKTGRINIEKEYAKLGAREERYKSDYEAFYGVKLEGEHVPEGLEDLLVQDLRVRALRLCIERGSINEDELSDELNISVLRAEVCIRWMVLYGYAEECEGVKDDDGEELAACRPIIEMHNFNCLLSKNRK